MKIRSITCFYDPGAGQTLEPMALLAAEAARQFAAAGFEVETTRAVTPPFQGLLPRLDVESAVQFATRMEAEAGAHGFSYLSLGPAEPSHPETYDLVAPMIAATRNVFVTGIMATGRGGVNLPAVRACARVIVNAATITPDGFGNLRFAALANVPPHVPFFPAAYHDSSGPAFGLAIECADAAVAAFQEAHTLMEARALLLQRLNSAGAELARLGDELARRFQVAFKGIDFSLAPFPEDWCSLAGAMERVGIQQVGVLGSTAAAAILADTLDQGSWPRTGFNGIMLPVLEDSVMARRTDGPLSVKDLLLISSVCGAGPDCVPLPGEATPEQLAAFLLDVSALAVRLGKPLAARLMPIPGKSAGDMTTFDFGYFANGRVMALPAAPLRDFLAGEETVSLKPRMEYHN